MAPPLDDYSTPILYLLPPSIIIQTFQLELHFLLSLNDNYTAFAVGLIDGALLVLGARLGDLLGTTLGALLTEGLLDGESEGTMLGDRDGTLLG